MFAILKDDDPRVTEITASEAGKLMGHPVTYVYFTRDQAEEAAKSINGNGRTLEVDGAVYQGVDTSGVKIEAPKFEKPKTTKPKRSNGSQPTNGSNGKITNKSDTETVLRYVRNLTFPPGARVEQVGKWIWIHFSGKPPSDVRSNLKNAGFRWNRKRSAWQHPCGVFRRYSRGNPKKKYQVRRVRVEVDDD